MSMRNAKTTEQYDWALQARSALVAKMGVSGELTGALEKFTRGATGLGYDIRAGLHGSEYSQQLDYLTSFEFMANADPAGYRAGKTVTGMAGAVNLGRSVNEEIITGWDVAGEYAKNRMFEVIFEKVEKALEDFQRRRNSN